MHDLAAVDMELAAATVGDGKGAVEAQSTARLLP